MTRSWRIHGRKQLQISKDGLALYLRLGYIPAPYALLKDTYMLEPGAWLEVNREGQVKGGKFFEFPLFQEPDLRGEEAYEAVDAAITRAVRRHLVSDVPVGTFLSGGIDSPLVAAKAKAASNGTVRCFTIGTGGDELDESGDAKAYAQEIGVNHVVEHVTPETGLGDAGRRCQFVRRTLRRLLRFSYDADRSDGSPTRESHSFRRWRR